ncbi:MAG: AMP-binding protein [Betaproteobacteria bacterium]
MNSVEDLLAGPGQADRPALICGAESVSFGELAERVRRNAAASRGFGVQPGERVLLLMRDTPAFAAAWLGTIYAGAGAIALNSRLPEADYRHILADSGARLVIVEDLFTQARPDLTAELAGAKRLAVAGAAADGLPSWDEAARQARPMDAHQVEAETPALWLYSSGTTGHPKGIVHSHRAISCVGGSFRALGVQAGERVFTTSRLFFAYGLEHGLLAPLALGATSLLSADWPDAETVIEVVTRHQPAAMFSVPTIYRRLLAEPPARLAAFAGVRRFVAGGERLSARLVEQWREASGRELLNLYGMSETFCACVLTPPGTSDGVRTGQPLPGVEVRLLDSSEREAPPGEPGVLWVRHPAQARSYANLPEKTRQQFRHGWFCSRDMFVRDAAGFLVHQGRSDELLKIAGQWVHPGELEEVAARSPVVAEAACVPMVDADGLERLALFITAQGNSDAALRAAADACESALPRHKRPKWLRAVAELPRTATGKVQRYKLRELLERELTGKD